MNNLASQYFEIWLLSSTSMHRRTLEHQLEEMLHDTRYDFEASDLLGIQIFQVSPGLILRQDIRLQTFKHLLSTTKRLSPEHQQGLTQIA
jgi:hypothetical protein